MLYSLVVLLHTTYENGKQSGKHLWCEWPIALIIYILTSGQTFKVINPDAFATGFGERMRTFSQEKRALRIVS